MNTVGENKDIGDTLKQDKSPKQVKWNKLARITISPGFMHEH
jgi:hypothetical protein